MILGSTGSIGCQAVDVVLSHPDDFRVIGLAANNNVEVIAGQIRELKPEFVCLFEEDAARALKEDHDHGARILFGNEGIDELCALDEADIILNAIVGSAGLWATLAAIKAGKRLALANKESLVAAGDLVNKELKKHGAEMIPVDSEHNALWQCLNGENRAEVSKLILTASGGPFWGQAYEQLATVTPEQALKHPSWNMGRRVTIDSATLMNKGFEVIEAHHLFGLGIDKIEVLVHPQSIVHSLVEFIDCSIMAHLGPTDMRLPILYSFSWPRRLNADIDKLDLALVKKLDFADVDIGKTPCLKLAYQAARSGLSYPTALNAADEVGVDAFLEKKIGFTEIGDIIDTVLQRHDPVSVDSIDDFEAVDNWARLEAWETVKRVG